MGADGEVALVVVELLDDEPLAERVPGQDRPAGSLDAERRRGEVRPQGVEGPEVLVDRCGDVARRRVPPSGERLRQKTVWFTCPARWKARFFWSRFTVPYASSARGSARCWIAVLAPLT